jgi:hypothetical protein
MKLHRLAILFSLFLFAATPAGESADAAARLVLVGARGPVAVPVDRATLVSAARDWRGTSYAASEGALRLLVVGLPSYASYFPKGTVVDRVALDERGFVLLLTLPRGFARTPNEPVTDAMMAALGQTMQSLGGAPVRVMARDDVHKSHVLIGKLFTYTRLTPRKPYESSAKAVGPPGFGQPQPAGFLSGKSIFLAPGHGWYYNDDLEAWLTQRGNSNGIVEDFSNGEPVFQYLLPYFWNAGAGVYTCRERDLNTQMTILDNGDAGFSTTGAWTASTSVGGYYGDDYLVAPVSLTETATATFTPSLPADGFYHVYVWFTAGANRATDCPITIRHADGETTVVQNQQHDGFTWTDLGEYYFQAEGPAENRQVVISNEGSNPATFVIADAVRFGGGVYPNADKPRWEMSGLYHAPFTGCPECASNTVTTMPLYTAWEHESWEDGIYLSWHTNAPNPASGTSTFAYSSDGWDGAFDGVPGSLELRSAIHDEIVADIRAGWASTWPDLGEHTNWYGEINPNYNAETPGIIFEVAFHDTPADAEKLKEPGFRKLVARAVYQGAVRYYAERDGETPRFLPEPPQAPAVQWLDGDPTVSWLPPPYDYGGLAGDPADGYRVYLSRTGQGFGDAIETTREEAGLSTGAAARGPVWYGRMTAYNEGGESFPTETLAISLGPGPRVLIVNGFDRLDKSANVPESYYGGGTIYRGYLRRMNTYDYVIAHAEALAAAGVQFDSASNEAVTTGAIDLVDYPAVVWIVGEESTADVAFSATEQALLAAYLDDGGALFVSGSEIGWDLWENGSAADQAFYADYLRAEYVQDSSGTGLVSGDGLFGEVGAFTFDYDDYLIYAANFPDCLQALAGGFTDLYYGTGQGAGVADDTGVFRVVHLGFPFETIYDAEARAAIMSAAMEFLLADDDDNDDNNDNDDNDDDNDDSADDDDNDNNDNDTVDDDSGDDDDDDTTPGDDDDESTTGCGC